MKDYDDFLRGKHSTLPDRGFIDCAIGDFPLFPFQRACTEFALRKGRAALFEGCGLGKSRQLLVWAHHVTECTGGRVLVLCPLAVAGQLKREADAIGVDAVIARKQDGAAPRGITITNYEMLRHFDARAFVGVVLDESGALKSYTGSTKKAIVSAFADTPYRLACTATPAPNDLLELLNQADFLGVLSSHEAIARWFTNTDKAGVYRLRHWARDSFWDWVTSWARCVEKPSDLGFDDAGFVLPPLERVQHVLPVDVLDGRGDQLFRDPNLSATAFHQEGRRTAETRARKVAELVTSSPSEQWIVWCDTDYDDDAVRAVLPDVVSVRGSGVIRGTKNLTADEEKERAILDFCDGDIRTIVCKPRSFGFGLNLQNCAQMVFARPSYSYEQHYQAERRCYRFGQKRAVTSHTVMAATEVDVYASNRRKADQHANMIREMYDAARRANERRQSRFCGYEPAKKVRLPNWIHRLEGT